MQKHIILGTSLTLLATLITGCDINKDEKPNTNFAAPIAQTTQVTITPSLGKILNAKVVLKNAKTGEMLGEGTTGNTGVAQFTATKTADPVVVEVMGQANAKYFDESKGMEVNFAEGNKIRAALPTLIDNIGVSTLTEVAYQTARNTVGTEKPLDASSISSANEAIRKALAPELTSINAVPHLVGAAADLATIVNNEAGKYALKLAALAKLVSSEDATPALTIINQLAADIKDGEFDGLTKDAISLAYTKANLANKITININEILRAAQLTGFTVSEFNPVFGSIVVTIGEGGTGSGCVLSVSIANVPIQKVCYKNLLENAACSVNNAELNAVAQVYASVGGSLSFAQGSCEGADITVDFSSLALKQ